MNKRSVYFDKAIDLKEAKESECSALFAVMAAACMTRFHVYGIPMHVVDCDGKSLRVEVGERAEEILRDLAESLPIECQVTTDGKNITVTL